MKIKIGKDIEYSFLIFFSFLIAMQLEMSRTILLVALSFLFFIANYLYAGRINNNTLNELRKICMSELVFLACFIGVQVVILGLNIEGVVTDISILSCVYIGIIIGSMSMKPYSSFEIYLRAVLMFLIAFSAYYIIEVIMHGLPEGRNSVIGNVSSNYCCAIIYLNYPVIFYNLFARTDKEQRSRNLAKYCYIALLLSMIVIVLSGSRTAIGAIALVTGLMLFYRQRRVKAKIRFAFLILLGLFITFLLYKYNQDVRSLMGRALESFGGKSILDSNVRQLIWKAGLQQFHEGNVVFGLGTNIVIEFERSTHNLFYEVLMCSGYIGMALFIITTAYMLIFVLKKQRYKQRFFSVMLLISTLLTALVQPFFSTSYTCGMMVWMSLFSLTSDVERETL